MGDMGTVFFLVILLMPCVGNLLLWVCETLDRKDTNATS